MRSLSARPRLVFAAIVTAVAVAAVSVQAAPATAAPAATATLPTCAPTPDGLVAWWPFDEAGGTVASDIAGGQHDLTLGTGEVWHPSGSVEPGNVRGALEFGGSSAGDFTALTVADAPELRFGTGDFSIDFWIKIPTGTETNFALVGLLQKRGWTAGPAGNAGDGWFSVVVRHDRYELQIVRTGGGHNYFKPVSPVVVKGAWQHVAIAVRRTAPDAGVKFYIDGNLVSVNSVNDALDPLTSLLPPYDLNNTAPLMFGGGFAQPFTGLLDEVELYNVALSDDDVTALYAAGAAGHCLPSTPPCVDICELDARVIALESCPSACALDVRLQAAEATVPILQAQVATLQGQVSALEAKVAALGGVEARLAALEDKLQHVSRAGNDLTISGANLHVVNGTGATDGGPNALGNVIVGYNEARPGGGDPRTGSHMVVVGRGNSYSAFGGIVAGENNTARGRFATVGGGNGNLASGDYSSVSGGQGNISGAYAASVSGGQSNTATRSYASASGGRNNTASGNYASVSGGQNNTASGSFASVSGGSYNTAAGTSYASVSGGTSNTATGSAASVCGGIVNTASGRYASVTGGSSNTAAAEASTVGGGDRNTANGVRSTVGGGANRSTTAGQTNAWRGGNLIQPN
ncbi:MAG: hypothetical protein IPG72_14640 [Ardenticatenales bacterium]|nr:hypothetical protein [Ardenticatenales bacterium]